MRLLKREENDGEDQGSKDGRLLLRREAGSGNSIRTGEKRRRPRLHLRAHYPQRRGGGGSGSQGRPCAAWTQGSGSACRRDGGDPVPRRAGGDLPADRGAGAYLRGRHLSLCPQDSPDCGKIQQGRLADRDYRRRLPPGGGRYPGLVPGPLHRDFHPRRGRKSGVSGGHKGVYCVPDDI